MFDTLEQEYTPLYCQQLEAAYGEGMMSESEGFDLMFGSLSIGPDQVLDIGAGLGGVAFSLASRFPCHVIGLEVSPWMVEEATRRIPSHLSQAVAFVLSTSNTSLPFEDASFDLVYSKGVLTHIEEKGPLFAECFRILKPGGRLLITDWLSSEKGVWGHEVARLIELEHLTLYPLSQSAYQSLLAPFGAVAMRDDSAEYLSFNQKIIQRLSTYSSPLFDSSSLASAIEGYEAIARALETGELRVLRIEVQKR
jgi:phosphoethanolamine N-methyltransferase